VVAGLRAALAPILAIAALAAPAVAQVVDLDDPVRAYLRLMQISGRPVVGSYTVLAVERPSEGLGVGHPWGERLSAMLVAPPGLDTDGDAPRLHAQGALFRAFVNTHHPDGQDDGAVWQGRGLTTALDVGATLRWGALTVTAQPTLTFSQNASFDLAPVQVADMPPYAYPWRRIDWPQRFGTDPHWRLDPGQSEVRVDWRGARAAFGTRNLWWGPGIRNAIVMGASAPGFPHASLGTSGPVDIGIGALEVDWIWGRLGQSDWAPPDLPTDDRFLTGIALAYDPTFLPGLTLGATRVFQRLVPPGGVDLGDYFLVFQGLLKSGLASDTSPDGTDESDQMLSLFWRWVMPESGFEAYMEWARTDHSWNLADLIQEPEHSRGYTLGLQKLVSEAADRLVVLGLEATTLESTPTFQLRPRPTFYEHSIVAQGYTHEGQLLGASVGPGGSAQAVSLDVFAPWGKWGALLRRRVHDNDAYWVWAQANGLSFDQHHVSLDVGGSVLRFMGAFEAGGGLMVTREFNRYFGYREGWNVHFDLSLRWRPG
jgi:hypothetical protein